MSDIVLSKGIRSNLLNLQKTADLTATTQTRLATGKKVNTALDNPTNFFTSASLQSRANDLGALLDGISNGIQTLQGADNGLTAIKNVIESMQSTARQARQDKTWVSESFPLGAYAVGTTGKLTFDKGALGAPAEIDLDAAAAKDGDATTLTVDDLVMAINSDSSLKVNGQALVSASNDNGQLRIKNVSTTGLEVTGLDATGKIDGSGTTPTTIDGNTVRANLVDQFNVLRDQLDKISQDAQYNGVNLLQGDELKLYFNETGTSTIKIQSTDALGNPQPINCDTLSIDPAVAKEFESDSKLDARLNGLKAAIDQIATQASTFGSNLSVVENRQEFTKAMINTLKTGSDNLTLADQNEEAANLLALQTRQQLSQTALSLANQADQGVLRLFG
jgi:hypothetical protein